MLKYVDTKVVFRELPDEITLAINLSGCPCHCEGCHSPYLADDIGAELDYSTLERLIQKNTGITAVCLMGGDGDQRAIYDLACQVKRHITNIRVGWYSGRAILPSWFNPIDNGKVVLDYIKLGAYIAKFGSLDKPTTNQRLYKLSLDEYGECDVKDITELLRKSACIS